MSIIRNTFTALLLTTACAGCVVVEESSPVIVREPGPVVVQEQQYVEEPVTHVHYFRFQPRHHRHHDRTVVVVPRGNTIHQTKGPVGGGSSGPVVVNPGRPVVQQTRGRAAPVIQQNRGRPAPVIQQNSGQPSQTIQQSSQHSAVIQSSGVQVSQSTSAPAN